VLVRSIRFSMGQSTLAKSISRSFRSGLVRALPSNEKTFLCLGLAPISNSILATPNGPRILGSTSRAYTGRSKTSGNSCRNRISRWVAAYGAADSIAPRIALCCTASPQPLTLSPRRIGFENERGTSAEGVVFWMPWCFSAIRDERRRTTWRIGASSWTETSGIPERPVSNSTSDSSVEM
jgi:hypothetical protein